MMISLYGKLARSFEKKFKTSARNLNMKIHSGREFMRAMEANFPGFRTLINKHGYYRLVRGDTITDGTPISEKELTMKFNETDFHLMPVAAGAGGKALGVLTIIAGVVLVAVGIYTRNPTMIMMGIGLLAGGVSSVFFPPDQTDTYEDRESPDERASFIFNGPLNKSAPGATIPIAYGETFIGSLFVSGGLEIVDIV